MREESADLLRLHHFFSILITWDSSMRSNQDSGRSHNDRSQDKRGQIESLYTLSFCWLGNGDLSVTARNFSSFCAFMSSVERRALIGSLRNDTGLFSRYVIFLSERVKFGFLFFPVWPQMEMVAHLGTLAFKWDQSSHRSVT